MSASDEGAADVPDAVPDDVPGPDEEAEARIKEVSEEDAWPEPEPEPGSDGRRKSRLRRTLSRWASSSDQHARELRRTVAESGLTTISDAPDRVRVQLSGTLRTVTLRPRGGVPALEAELFDGSGAITLVWLGRRQITGISPGRALEVEGRIGNQDGVRVMYNPRYELRA